MDNPLIAVFLGVIALAALMQAMFFLGATIAGWKAMTYLDTLTTRAESELVKLSGKLDQLSRQVEDLTRQAHEKVARTEPLVDTAAANTWRAGHAVRRAVESPQTTLQKGTALLHGVLRAVEAYRALKRPSAR
jgi:hypothetical protein